MYSHKTMKFAKVFSLESFPLYGMSLTNCTGFHTEGEGPEIPPPLPEILKLSMVIIVL